MKFLIKRNKKDDKKEILEDYKNTLIKSKNDDAILYLASQIEIRNAKIEVDERIKEEKGFLRALYHVYRLKSHTIKIKLANANDEDKHFLEEEKKRYDLFLYELAPLIINYKNAKLRKEKLSLLEKELTKEEINLIQSEVIIEDEERKR